LTNSEKGKKGNAFRRFTLPLDDEPQRCLRRVCSLWRLLAAAIVHRFAPLVGRFLTDPPTVMSWDVDELIRDIITLKNDDRKSGRFLNSDTETVVELRAAKSFSTGPGA
jgi:hypothetical protein